MALKRTAHDAFGEVASHTPQPRVYSNISADGDSRQHNGDIHQTFNLQYGDSEQLDREQKLRQILNTLSFPEMNSRKDTIPSAAEHTFGWLLKPDQAERMEPTSHILDDARRPWQRDRASERSRIRVHASETLLRWLAADNGLFWISGKAGSGKSVLTKFLRNVAMEQESHGESTLRTLRSIVSDHYFWSPGSRLQNSVEGMLRTILHQILLSCPELATRAVPSRWSAAGHGSWSENELFQAISATREAGIRLIVFVDGLDECRDSHHSLLERVHMLSRLPQIRVCVSSRPWLDFQASFARCPSLRLEDVSRVDFQHYALQEMRLYAVKSSLRSELVPTLSESAARFLLDLVCKAEGVFLWLFLVLRRLGPRVRFAKTFDDLSPHLESFPSELEAYLRDHVYSRIKASWREASDTAAVLRFCLAGVDTARAYEPLLTGQAFRDPLFGISQQIEIRDDSQASRREVEVREFIQECCADLLVLEEPSPNSFGTDVFVEYSHRSVVEFLNTVEMTALLKRKTPPHFENARELRGT